MARAETEFATRFCRSTRHRCEKDYSTALVAVFVRMVFAGGFGVFTRMHGMAMGYVRMVCRFLMLTNFMVSRRLVVMFGRMLVMISCLFVVLGTLVWHRWISLDLKMRCEVSIGLLCNVRVNFFRRPTPRG